MKTISLKDVAKNKVDMVGAVGASKQVPLSKSDGAPVYSYRVFTLDPGGNTPFHQHDYEHMNYIIEGEGYLVDENGEKHPVNKGDFALVLPNEKHQYLNKSTEKEFVMICGVPNSFE
jgi:quercetin dioxygenase-like cupin family protein